ncbi:MAG TPA: hypothetical protein VF159_10710 [Gemmatimonadaceae bacterium]
MNMRLLAVSAAIFVATVGAAACVTRPAPRTSSTPAAQRCVDGVPVDTTVAGLMGHPPWDHGLAVQLCGFAGLYARPGHGSDTLVVMLTDLAYTDKALKTVRGLSIARRFSVFAVEPAKYDYLQLERWNVMVGRLSGLSTWGINEKENVVAVGTVDAASERAVRNKLREMGLPSDAIRLSVIGRFQFQAR